MKGFVPTLGRTPRVLYIGFASVALKFGFLTPRLAGIGKLLSTSNVYTIRTIGAVVLSS